MRRTLLRCVLLLVPLLAGAPARSQPLGDDDPYAAYIPKTGPRTPEGERRGFHLPDGFEIQLVAAEPDIHKPLNLAFDDRGRLWVSETVEYPFPAAPGTTPRDRLRILEDTDGDGRADRFTTFADGLNIPIGLLPLPHGAMAYSIPNIYRFTDRDGDDHADERAVLYGSFGFGDTHGMTSAFTWGFDGWVYACHGFSNSSEIHASDGSSVRMQSGNTYRMRPDGSHVEQFTHGQVNPFGLAFDPLGNLYSADCHSRPVMMLLRGAYYSSFGKPDDGIGFGPEMCKHDHGSTAISGIVYYAADQFPTEYHDTIFIGNPVTNRIDHDRLERHGSTLEAILQPDFLASDDPWFRPVDIKLGPDGALYVADFYNKVIGHYEVPLTHPERDRERGRIWRIVYHGSDGKRTAASPRSDWGRATIGELVDDLAHPNLTVRMKATHQLVERGGDAAASAVRAIMGPESSPFQRMHGLWVLDRLGMLDDELLARAAYDPAGGVRVHAMRVLAERAELPDRLHELALRGLADSDAFVQRAAADALGRHPLPANLRPLLELRPRVPPDDTHLLHVVRMALRDQLRLGESWVELPGGWSDRDAAAVADVATGVPSGDAAAFLLGYLERGTAASGAAPRYVRHVARYAGEDLSERLLTFARRHQPDDLGVQLALVRAMEQGAQERGARLSDPARVWAEELVGKLLASRDTNLRIAGTELVGSLKIMAARDRLGELAGRQEAPEPERAAALAALVSLDADGSVPLLAAVLRDAAEPVALRERAANLLAGLNRPAARDELVECLRSVPERLERSVASGLAMSPAGGRALLDSIAAGRASARVLQDPGVQIRLAAARLPDLKQRLAELTRDLLPEDNRLRKLMDERRAGYARARTDPEAGARVFEKSCAACHQLAGRGAKVGPQLDGIGVRGPERLIEDVFDPNRNVDQAFRSSILALTNGQVLSGLVLREEGEIVVLADSLGKEVRVPKSDIAERKTSGLSPMPANLADQISDADFYNLLAYLLKQSTPSPPAASGSNGE